MRLHDIPEPKPETPPLALPELQRAIREMYRQPIFDRMDYWHVPPAPRPMQDFGDALTLRGAGLTPEQLAVMDALFRSFALWVRDAGFPQFEAPQIVQRDNVVDPLDYGPVLGWRVRAR